jgi:hypothetical protein
VTKLGKLKVQTRPTLMLPSLEMQIGTAKSSSIGSLLYKRRGASPPVFRQISPLG